MRKFLTGSVDPESWTRAVVFKGRRPNGFLGLSLNDRTIIFLVILLDKTVFALRRLPQEGDQIGTVLIE